MRLIAVDATAFEEALAMEGAVDPGALDDE
jgi:hypothetical protein